VVTADLHITGKVAQFGRGIMGDVSKKLMDQFAANLNTMLDEQGPDAEPAAAVDAPTTDSPADTPAAADVPASAAEAPKAAEPASTGPTVRKINGPAAEPVDLAGMAGPAVIKRLAPAVAVILLLVLLLRRRK
jgi:uncharacterized protein